MSISQPIHVTADAIVFSKESKDVYLLLIKRKNDPYKNSWALPGGFVNKDELVINACQRELKEETHLEFNLNQFHFLGYYDKIAKVTADDDAGQAQWFSLKNLPELAFDHLEIITDAQKNINF